MNEKDIEKLLAGVAPEGITSALEGLLGNYQTALAQDFGRLGAELERLRAASQTQTAAATDNTRALLENTAAQASGGGLSLASAGKTVWKVLGSGLTLSPLWKGLASLFSSSKEEEAPPLTAYLPPPSVRLEGEVTRSGGAEQTSWEWEQLWRRQSGPRPAPQITVQVQAMDSRSFLDHSEEIARAVRAAMLESHSLNDVVSEV